MVILERKKLTMGKVQMRGKFFQRCAIFCTAVYLSLGGKVNTRRMSQPDMESIFTKIIYEIFCSLETILWIFKIIKIKCFYHSRVLDEHWCVYSCLQIAPRENWFQYVRRVYATSINFPCISTLTMDMYGIWMLKQKHEGCGNKYGK